MADTRDINSSANYCLEQKGMQQIRDHLLYENGPNGNAYNPAFPLLYNNGHVPANVLSCNSIDIESSLWGINANNLVNPQQPTVAKLKSLPDTSFFERPIVINEKPVYADNSQRPFIVR